MDPEELTELGRRFWYGWAAFLIAGSGLLFLGTWYLRPGSDPWLVAIQGVLALLFVAFGAVAVALGNRVDAAGQALAALGFTVLAVSTARGLTWRALYAGLALAAVGGAIGLWSDLGDRIRGSVGQ